MFLNCGDMNSHQKFLEILAQKIASLSTDRIQRVAIDGVDGAGKTTFADALLPLIENFGRKVIRASVDGFHNSRKIRYRHGKGPESFFNDSYNYTELIKVLLDPLSPNGDRKYISAIFNVDKDEPILSQPKIANGSEILLFDGIFLHRSELRDYWDYSIFLDVAFEKSIPRGAQRGTGSPDVFAPSNIRYIEGQKIYLSQCRPQEKATLHVDYNNLDLPSIIRI